MSVLPVPIQQYCICSGFQDAIKLKYESLWHRLATRAFCICLKNRPDRFQAAATQFHRYGLCRIVRFYMVVAPTDEECRTAGVLSRGRFGIWNSHTGAAKLGFKDESAKSVLLFEDDFVFRDAYMNLAHFEQVVIDFEQVVKPLDFDVFKLGQHTRRGTPVLCGQGNDTGWPSQSRIYKSDSVLLHCYLWSRKGAQILFDTSFSQNKADNKGEEEDIDSWMIRRQLKMYNCFPQLVVQSGSLSSNTGNAQNTFLDRVERVYWPMIGSYFQRKFCDELDLVALHGSTVIELVVVLVLCLLVMYVACSFGFNWLISTRTMEMNIKTEPQQEQQQQENTNTTRH